MRYRPIYERFAEKYKVMPSGCWEWQASKVTGGYGMLGGSRGSGNILAHRFSYEHVKGPVPEGKIVCHSCDNPSCVNPEHLRLGDHLENMRDMARKGRARLLWPESVDEAARMLSEGYSQTSVARHFGVSRSTIVRSVTGQFPCDVVRRDVLPQMRYTKLTGEQRSEILTMLQRGDPIAVIARQMNADRKTIRNIRDKNL